MCLTPLPARVSPHPRLGFLISASELMTPSAGLLMGSNNLGCRPGTLRVLEKSSLLSLICFDSR